MIKNIYIHIPFCSSRCSYCNFSTLIIKNKNLHINYTASLIYEIKKNENIIGNLRSIYFGGGSPSLINPNLIGKILNGLKSYKSQNTEILIETNPEHITDRNLKLWKEIGVNRISIGIQTFQNKFSSFLERKINSASLSKKIHLARMYIEVVSIDLIFGFPNQEIKDLQKDLNKILKLDIDHISYYALDYKHNSKISGKINDALDFETVVEYYNFICAKLNKIGFKQYEIYNFGKKCIHNLDFWNGKDYLGFGLSAVSTIGNNVIRNTSNLNKYLSLKDIKIKNKLTKSEINCLLLQRNLRLNKGIQINELEKIVPKKTIQKIINSKYILKTKSTIKLNQKGKMYFGDFFDEIY